jgi:hypothetical protein
MLVCDDLKQTGLSISMQGGGQRAKGSTRPLLDALR